MIDAVSQPLAIGDMVVVPGGILVPFHLGTVFSDEGQGWILVDFQDGTRGGVLAYRSIKVPAGSIVVETLDLGDLCKRFG